MNIKITVCFNLYLQKIFSEVRTWTREVPEVRQAEVGVKMRAKVILWRSFSVPDLPRFPFIISKEGRI